MLKPGDRIGDWVIDSPLGEGGMGAVYRAHSALGGRVVAALKVMKRSADPDAAARFVREAEALSALHHPAIVRVMGFNLDAARGLVYLVMELAVGETLKRRLEGGPMALEEALGTFGPLSSGLEHAHAAGIFHCDLKPSNVVLAADGVRLVDFGIAAGIATEADTAASGGGHLGTLSYLPPEVFRGEPAEPRGIDVYGFGQLLHEALTGLRAFPVEAGLSPPAAAAAIGMRKVRAPAMDPGEATPEVVRDLVRRATDPDPRARPDMAEIRRGLATLVDRRTAGAVAPAAGEAVLRAAQPWTPSTDPTTWVRDPPTALGRARDGGGATASRTGRRGRDRRRGGMAAWVAGALAAALLAFLAVMATRCVSDRANRSGGGVSPAPSMDSAAPRRPGA